MRTRTVYRALFGLTVCAGLIFILVINISRSFLKQKKSFLQDTISILGKGIEVVDDFRQNENGRSYLKEAQVNIHAEEGTVGSRRELGVDRTRAEADVATANGKQGMAETRDKGSALDSLAEESTVKTHASEGVVDTRDKEGVTDARVKEGVTDTRAKEGVTDTRAKEGVTDARAKEGVTDARAKEGVTDARAKEGVTDTRAKEGVTDTRAKEGVTDTRAKEGVTDARAKEDVTDTRAKADVTNTHSQGSSLDSKDNAKDSKPKRPSLLMIGHDRSGTTFINRMFNEDPNIFNVYEPLWVTSWIGSPENHADVIIDVLNGILNCNFSATTNGIKFLVGISRWIAVRMHCKAMMSPPFCEIKNGEQKCEKMTPGLTDEVCAKKYQYSVTKIGVPRIPKENISCVLERLLDKNPQARVLYMVRDPRGAINSRINAGWIKDYPDPGLNNSVQSVCDTTTYNLGYIQLFMKKNEYKDRCMIVKYKDISADPVAVAKKIYNFARFPFEPTLTDWIVSHTRPSKKELQSELHKPFSVVRNATGIADKWRKEAPVERVRAINKVCAPLLRLLGVLPD